MGHMYIEIGLIALQTLILTIIFLFLSKGIAQTILTGLIELDNKIATAIQQVVEGNFNLPEPPNPIQALIVEAFKNNLGKKETNIELLRDKDGKFK